MEWLHGTGKSVLPSNRGSIRRVASWVHKPLESVASFASWFASHTALKLSPWTISRHREKLKQREGRQMAVSFREGGIHRSALDQLK